MERTELRQLAADVAEALGNGWNLRADDDSYGAHIDHSDGRALWLHAPGYLHSMRGKVTISGSYPYRPGQYIPPGNRVEINVTAARGAAVIAREISRRLLPDYNERYAEVIKANDAHAGSVASVRNAAALFYAALGIPEPKVPDWRQRDRDRDARESISLYSVGSLCGSVELYAHSATDVRARLELSSLPAETALEIVGLLRKLA